MAVKKIFVRSPYNYDMNEASDEHGLSCPEPTLTQQNGKDEADINFLVERYTIHDMPQLTLPPLQGDFTNAPTMQEALNLMVEANRSFMQLPAKIRSRFANDPAEFVAFCSDEANRDEMRRMGLWSQEAVQAFQEKARLEAEARAKDAADAAAYREGKPPTPPQS